VLLPMQVFLQRSAVNLLGVVLDTPDFFWSAPDHLQVRQKDWPLTKGICLGKRTVTTEYFHR
jgi:hypothetical protein